MMIDSLQYIHMLQKALESMFKQFRGAEEEQKQQLIDLINLLGVNVATSDVINLVDEAYLWSHLLVGKTHIIYHKNDLA